MRCAGGGRDLAAGAGRLEYGCAGGLEVGLWMWERKRRRDGVGGGADAWSEDVDGKWQERGWPCWRRSECWVEVGEGEADCLVCFAEGVGEEVAGFRMDCIDQGLGRCACCLEAIRVFDEFLRDAK